MFGGATAAWLPPCSVEQVAADEGIPLQLGQGMQGGLPLGRGRPPVRVRVGAPAAQGVE